MIEVELPDGSIVEFPPEMQQDEINAVLSQGVSPQQQQDTYEFSPLQSGIVGAAQGLSFGLADELASGVAGVGGALTGEGFTPAYERTMEQQQQAIAEAQRQNPKSFIGSEVVGGIGTALTGGGLVGAGKGLASGIGYGAASGGLYGGATGYGGVEERAGSALQGSALGSFE